MRRIRIGKDFTVRWSIFRRTLNGREEYVLHEKNIILRLQNAYRTETINNFTISGNVVEWTFRGKDQTSLGTYSLILIENNGEAGMMTIDKISAFQLVAHTEEENVGHTSDVSIDGVDVDSESSILPFIGEINIDIDENLSLESENPIMNKAVTKAINDVSASIPTKVSQLTNDKGYLTSHQSISHLATKEELSSGLTSKVDKISGMGLSANDYTTTEKNKLAGIAAGAEVNVQSDWSATSGDAFIKNKPSLAAVATSGSYNDLSNKPTIPAAVTESTISGWGFTKNTGTYSKPSTGIPKTDLASAVQTSLGKADTALQNIPSEYVTETELAGKGYATTSALSSGLSGKVDKVSGKQLSTEDFTTALKNKLQGLSNYDDASVNAAIAGLQQQLNTLTSGNASAAIESFNEIIAFLDGVKDTQDLAGIIASIEQQIAAKANASDIPTKVSQLTNDKGYLTSHQDISGLATKTELTDGLAEKQDIISDLATIRSGASKGATALQSIPSEYVTETELGSKGYAVASDVTTSLNGKVDKVSGKGLSTNDYTTTEKEKLAGIAAGAEVNVQSDWSATSGDAFIKNKPSLAAVATSGSYNDLSNKPTIPAAVTESTISGWGFTKNTGTYSKPSTGIPATDLASSVQTSLGKADTALQSYTEKYTGTYTKPSTGIPKTDLASAVQTSLGKADSALQSYTETDPVFKASAAAGITSSDITNWNGKTSNAGTITGIKMNGASKGTSGVVDLGTVITAHQSLANYYTKSEVDSKIASAVTNAINASY